jgi:methionyl-tRNA formyltransferase
MSTPPGSRAPTRTTPLRLGFAGTPDFAATILSALLEGGSQVMVVYTQPDRRAGRGRRLTPSAVKTMANDHHLEVRQPPSLRDETETQTLADSNLDVLIVAAYGLILPAQMLAVPRYGCINVHASLLPRWRGAAPVERAIMAGDTETGVSIMQMDAGLDTGPVLAQVSCPINDDTEGPDLESTLAVLGASCLLDCLQNLESLHPEPQRDEGATYATKLSAADARIDWQQSAQCIQRQVRALCGRSAATTALDNLRIKLLNTSWRPESADQRPGTILRTSAQGIHVSCGEGLLVVHRLQLNRGKGQPLEAAAAINGYPDIFAVGGVLAGPA